MNSLTQWESSPTFDPYNPNQLVREPNNTYPGQGGYSSFYWNKQPTTVSQVLGAILPPTTGGKGFAGLPPIAQTLIIGGIAAVVGFYGYRHIGPKLGLAGPRRRRSRR
jgi:hypothetical protein